MADTWASLGKVTVPVPGTPQRATANQTDPTRAYRAHAVLFQQVPDNVGKIWIGAVDMNKATGVGVLAVLAVPTANTIPSASATMTIAPDAFDVSNYRIDADVADEGCFVSALRY